MIEVLVALGVSMLIGVAAALTYRVAAKNAWGPSAPIGSLVRPSPPPHAPPPGSFRLVAHPEPIAPTPQRRSSGGGDEIPTGGSSERATTTSPAPVAVMAAPRFRLARRAVAPDAICMICGQLLRECAGHAA